MVWTLDPRSGIAAIPAWIIVFTFFIAMVNEILNVFALTQFQSQVLTVIGFAFVTLVALLTQVKETPTE